jgi:hypothetical protein
VLSKNTRLSAKRKYDPVKRANIPAPACVNGLEEGTRPLVSKAKKQSQGLPNYTDNKVANCVLKATSSQRIVHFRSPAISHKGNT